MDEQAIGVGIISKISADSPMILRQRPAKLPGKADGPALRRLPQMMLAPEEDGGLGHEIMEQAHKPS